MDFDLIDLIGSPVNETKPNEQKDQEMNAQNDISSFLDELDNDSFTQNNKMNSNKTGTKKNIFWLKNCVNISCVNCDQKVIKFENSKWDDNIDYLFVRLNFPFKNKLSNKLIKMKNYDSFCCQCYWISTNYSNDINDISNNWICDDK